MHNTSTKIYIIILMLLGSVSAAFAQTGKVSGMLQDAQGKPMDYASVSLLLAKDSSLVNGSLSTEAGTYSFAHVKAAAYMIKVTEVGYETIFSKPFIVNDSMTSVIVPLLKMKATSSQLNTVNITATKPVIQRLPDRMVMTVAGTILAAGNTAMDILERAPGVTIDKDDNISLKGKQGVTVMINDKLTYLSTAQLAALLRGTDGSTIQSIEIITNPSAKYDAAGNSGIINIKLKKNKLSGTNGSISADGAVGTYVKNSASFNINHKDGNLNVFAGFSRGDDPGARVLDINRTVIDTNNAPTYFKQQSFMPHAYHYNNYNIGADYETSSKNTLGFAVNGYFNYNNQNNTNNTYISSTPDGAPDSSQVTLSNIRQSYKDVTVDLNDTYKIDTLGQELAFDVDYSKFSNNSNAYYNTFFAPVAGITEAPIYLLNQTPSAIKIFAAKVDYSKPLTKSLKLETGIKFSDVKTDNDLEAQLKDSTGVYTNDAAQTNRFIYDEKITAAYMNFTKTFKNTSVEIGLRAERTTSNGDLVTNDSVVNRKYLNLFPSFFLNHTFNDKNELGFSYSRRIDRPDYSDLNPFVYYLDQYTYSEGNPFLKPQYTNNFELDYTYNKSINISANYSHTTDVIQQIILTDVAKKASYQTNLNLQSQNSYSISLNAPFTFTKWWSGNLDVNAFYLAFKSDTLLGGSLNNGKGAYNAKLTQTFMFAGFKAELFGNYQSALTDGIYQIHARGQVDGGISHQFDNKKLNVKFSVDDIFNTRRNNIDIDYQNDILTIRQKSDSRVARLTISYNFGNSSIKKREHKTALQEESQRAGGN